MDSETPKSAERQTESYWPAIKEHILSKEQKTNNPSPSNPGTDEEQEPLPTCPICYSELSVPGITATCTSDPKAPPAKRAGVGQCGHMFCLDCLRDHIHALLRRSYEDGTTPGPTCPLCRTTKRTFCRHYPFWAVERLSLMPQDLITLPAKLSLHPDPGPSDEVDIRYWCGVCLEALEVNYYPGVMRQSSANRASHTSKRVAELMRAFPLDELFFREEGPEQASYGGGSSPPPAAQAEDFTNEETEALARRLGYVSGNALRAGVENGELPELFAWNGIAFAFIGDVSIIADIVSNDN